MPRSNTHRAVPLSDADAARLRPADKAGTVRCKAAGGTATLLMYGEIGYDITALGVTQALASAGPVDTLDIRISSIGGSVIDGWAIFNVLARHPASQKTVTVEGMAASMASIVAMAGTTIIMPENSYMMIHNPSGVAIGGPNDMRSMADLLDHMQAVAAQTYSARSGQPVPVVTAMMSAETFMGADEAVALGFADQVERPLQMAASLDLDRLPNMPARMRASLSASMRGAIRKDPLMVDAPDTTLPPVIPPVVPPVPADTPQPAVVVPTPVPAPPHVGDGLPGALPVDVPDTSRPNTPGSPGYTPAEPVAVARACQAAGFPQMTTRLLEAGLSMTDVNADIERARNILQIATSMKQIDMAGPAIADGVGLETFRAMAFAAKAGAEPHIDTAQPQPSAQPGTPQAPLSSREINARSQAARTQH